MVEIFKDIDGFEGKYQVSNMGNVRSLNYLGTQTTRNLKPVRHHLGYMTVKLGAGRWAMVHTLVATAFIPNPDKKRCVNHIDGNKQNNAVWNLEWVTHKENNQHAIRTGLRDPHKNNKPIGNDNPTRRPILQYTLDGQFVRRWECISEAARQIGCRSCQINNNVAGRNKSCHGFIWRYPDE